MDYGIGSISVYDPADMMPYNEPPISEQIRFKKLGKEMKSEFKWLVSSVVIEYWQENRQIPFGEEMSKLRTRLLRMFAEEYSILLEDDTELKNYLLTLAITTINKHLKSENKKRVSKLSFNKITLATDICDRGNFHILGVLNTSPFSHIKESVISAATGVSSFHHLRYVPVPLEQSASLPP